MDNKEIDFITSRYRSRLFNADRGWRRLGISRRGFSWGRYRIAAAIAAIVVLSASAALIYNVTKPEAVEPTPPKVEAVKADAKTVKVIDFEDTPLTKVVEKIEETYGVKVAGLPAKPDDYKLSLHYEGTASDLLETINDILGTELKVKEAEEK